jgi:acetolactate synthase-1/2/3 large subunit
MRVADLVFSFFVEKGVDTVFSLTGGGAMFLNDAMAKNENLKCIFNHHEQASAMGALAYAKSSNKFGIACITTGCGGTNTITGVLDAWQDSTPVFFISGQCKVNDLMYSQKVPLRQVGVQEADIVEIVKPITKFATMVTDASKILEVLEEAYFHATTGRPGPVWIDLPMDIQSTIIEKEKLEHFKNVTEAPSEFDERLFVNLIANAKRPLILAGNGVHLSNTKNELLELVTKLNIPLATTFLGIDLIDSQNPHFLGPVGIKGVRSSNFALQNADLIICVGTRLSIPVTGYTVKDFAPNAKLLVIDIDPNEHKKTTSRSDYFFHSDLKLFFNSVLKLENLKTNIDPEWIVRTKKWKEDWAIEKEPHIEEPNHLNIYSFLNLLSKFAPQNSSFVSDAGSAYYCSSQALKLNGTQRYITSGAQADMGFTIPASIGAAAHRPENFIWGITGDGSFMTNLQEIFTILGYKQNIKIVVLNNNGYLSIKTTQKKFFPGQYVGTDQANGVYISNLEILSKAFNIRYFSIKSKADAEMAIKESASNSNLNILEVFCPEFQEIIPTLATKKDSEGKLHSRPLHDLYPFLDEKIINENMF